MYKHMLVATDGSDVAGQAVEHALGLAKAVGAKVTILTVTPPWSALAYGMVQGLPSHEAFDAGTAERAKEILDAAAGNAAALGVPCSTLQVVEVNPYQSILRAAEDAGCDLIVVGAHGRRGVERFLLGSETTKLLTHSKRPVLVWRG